MATIIERAKIDYEATVVLSMQEVRALAKVLEWGAEYVVDSLVKGTSTSEVGPYREVLTVLFNNLRNELPRVTRLGDDAVAVFQSRKIAHEKPREGHEWRMVAKTPTQGDSHDQ